MEVVLPAAHPAQPAAAAVELALAGVVVVEAAGLAEVLAEPLAARAAARAARAPARA